ncbi:hypothetical protein [Virgibacillus sp. YIM 98842]|uniref:hypothetical protein n=1 Tax=Virgibacillus sp. YIM 98842 TaxID=2663533 RepID=UPI0013DCF44B|nr:hypothetical protein [Virgibacillus sp. YIM 98842]
MLYRSRGSPNQSGLLQIDRAARQIDREEAQIDREEAQIDRGSSKPIEQHIKSIETPPNRSSSISIRTENLQIDQDGHGGMVSN